MNVQLRQILYIKTAQLYTLTHKLFNTNIIKRISKNLEEKFKDKLVQPKIEKETWESVRKHVIELSVHPSLVDSILLTVLKEKKLIDTGILYYEFLAKNNYDLTVTTQTYFLQLYEHKNPIEKGDKECILNLYKYFMNTYTSFEMNMSTTLVRNLCNIGEWRKAIKVIQKFETNDRSFLRHVYTDLISYLYNCGEADKAYEYLLISFKKGKGPTDLAYMSYLKYHLKNKHTVHEKIEELFSLWRKYGVILSKQAIQEYVAVCSDLGWSVKEANLEGLQCTVCKQKLLQTLSDKDYERLCKVTEQKLIFNNLYCVSNPAEIKKFINFINNGKPYDIIIDVLNFIYSNIDGYQMLKRNLVHFKKEGKKVLIIGRRHVKYMIEKLNLSQLANYFFVDNLSKDDPFILYAAFASGRNARIVSNDFMRQHKFAINDIELNILFKRWQLSQQYTFLKEEQDVDKLTQNLSIDAIAHKQSNRWHIPYAPDSTQSRKKQKFGENWICFNMRP